MQDNHTSPNEDTRTDPAPTVTTAPPSAGDRQRLVLRFATGLILYVILITGYIFVLQLSGEPLLKLYNTRTVVYAFVALFLIVTQGIVLEFITTFLAEQLGIVTREEV